MNQLKAQTTIVTTMAVAGGLIVVKAASEGHAPTTRQVVGVTVAGIGLSAFATVGSPQIAGSVALLWLTSAVFIYGGPAISALRKPLTKTATASGGGGSF